ncbi:hypothetical protein SAMN04487772_109115 [[Clostridium] polysaccharolyticum]|uniref:Uncharacterized protein n=1 Tax=[Clostridium] polysaccharolyticum TaxID=29364 RepID=A0A1I0CBF6_9FIRM|nr:hypothetical protein SAMN04487772_109115 [[Clostridium] polysaccharolyticum]
MIVNTLAPPTLPNQIQPTRSCHTKPKITLYEAESDHEGEDSEQEIADLVPVVSGPMLKTAVVKKGEKIKDATVKFCSKEKDNTAKYGTQWRCY